MKASIQARTARSPVPPLARRTAEVVFLLLGACTLLASGVALADEDEGVNAAGIKWNPGHYMLTYLRSDQARRLRHFDEIRNEPAVKGAQVRYTWGSLEPRKGEYDFSAIERDLEKLESMDKRLVIQVIDRAFNAKSPKGYMPEYLLTEAEYHGGAVPTKGGFVPRLWEPAVMDRQIELFRALGRRFNNEPFVEGIGGEETALGFGRNPPEGYSSGQFAKQLSRWLVAVRQSWPQTNVFFYTNWLGGELADLVAECAKLACTVGGPDVLPPPHKGTLGYRVLTGATGGTDYRGRIPVGYAVQGVSLKGQYTLPELYAFATEGLHANYIFWLRNTAVGGEGERWSTGILPFLRAIEGQARTECPPSLGDRCRPGGSRQ